MHKSVRKSNNVAQQEFFEPISAKYFYELYGEMNEQSILKNKSMSHRTIRRELMNNMICRCWFNEQFDELHEPKTRIVLKTNEMNQFENFDHKMTK